MKKQVTVKIKGKNVQFNYQSDLFGKIVLLLQKRSIDLEEVFMYPLGPIPYAVADDLGLMLKTRKVELLFELEKDIIYVDKIPRHSCSVIDGMALVRKIKGTGLTFNQLANDLLNTVLSTGLESTHIDVVFDVYKDYSIKNAERKRRCEHRLTGSQTIRQWNTFLGNNTNKTELVKFLASEWRKKELRKEVHVTCKNRCIRLNDGKEISELECQQEEADTRIFLHAKHASDTYQNTVIHTPDTDVVVLAIFYSKLLQISIFMKTGSKNKIRILSIERILENLKRKYNLTDVEEAASSIVALHAFTGGDTVSAFWRKGKKRPLQLMLKNEEFIKHFNQLGSQWTVNDELLMNLEAFVCLMYGSGTCKSVNQLRLVI